MAVAAVREKLLLVDPGENLSAVPSIIKTIDIPEPGKLHWCHRPEKEVYRCFMS